MRLDRIPALLSVVLIVVLGVVGCTGDAPTRFDSATAELSLGTGYIYFDSTLVRFRRLLADPEWTLADPPRNARGMLEAIHLRTGLVFVLMPLGSAYGTSSAADREPRPREPVAPFLISKAPVAGVRSAAGSTIDADEPGFLAMVLAKEASDWCRVAGLRLPTGAELSRMFGLGSVRDVIFVAPEDERGLPLKRVQPPPTLPAKAKDLWGIELKETSIWCWSGAVVPYPLEVHPRDRPPAASTEDCAAIRPAASLPD